MLGFLGGRLLQAVPVVLAVSLIAFGLLYLIPGDPALTLAGDQATAEDLDRIRTELGLSDPLPVQYVRWLSHAAVGDFGRSIRSQRPVASEIATRAGATTRLALTAMGIAIVAGVALGTLASYVRGSWLDQVILVISLGGVCVPSFWLGLMLILTFGVTLGWLPTTGDATPAHLVLPALVLAAAPLGIIARLTRTSMLEVLLQDFVRTARSKGLGERIVVGRHALRNALIPTVTIVGLQLGALLGGAVITETVFAWPGLGRLMVTAVAGRDYPVIRALLLLFALTFVLVNLAVDALYAALDPRLRRA